MLLLAWFACTDDPGTPSATTDVLVIGGGAAGLSAAWEADARGKGVLVLEREASAGGSSQYAERFWAAGTRFQAEAGVIDSVDQALADWAPTTGGDGADPNVIRFVQDSAATVHWLVDDLGVPAPTTVEPDLGYPGPPRMHALSATAAMAALTDPLGDRLLTSTEATELVLDADGVVIGARWHDRTDDTTGWIAAGATVVATGGFGRNLARVLDDRPELEGMALLVEIGPSSIGAGIPLLEGAGMWQNTGNSGIYVHSVPDPRPENPGEVLWPSGLESTLMIDGDGQRIANETAYNTFRLIDRLAATPSKKIFAFYPITDWHSVRAAAPAYTPTGPTPWTAQELEAARLARVYEDADAIAAALDLPPATLAATVARYDQAGITGVDTEFMKDRRFLHPFGSNAIVVMELHAGSAKSFVGYAVDADGRILGPGGDAVPGVFAAGEVIGMLGSPGIGSGLSGAITSCYLTGRAAGAAAAE